MLLTYLYNEDVSTATESTHHVGGEGNELSRLRRDCYRVLYDKLGRLTAVEGVTRTLDDTYLCVHTSHFVHPTGCERGDIGLTADPEGGVVELVDLPKPEVRVP